MTHFSTRTFFATAALIALTTSAFAQSARPWELKTDMGYAYGKDGKTWSYKMGTNNAGTLLKGAKKVPKGTLFLLARTASSTCAPAPISRATASSCSDPNRTPNSHPSTVAAGDDQNAAASSFAPGLLQL